MIFSFIIKTILALAFLLLLCIAFISKLNRSNNKEDMAQYKKDFDPYKTLSFYADEEEKEEFKDKDVKYYKQNS